MYCPGCGAENKGTDKYCRDCGNNLQSVQKAMSRDWLSQWFHKKIDHYVRTRSVENRILQLARSNLFISPLNLYLAWGEWSKDSVMFVYFLVMGILGLFIGSWDYLHYKRRLKRNSEKVTAQTASAIPTSAITQEFSDFAAEPPFSVIEATTLPLPPQITKNTPSQF